MLFDGSFLLGRSTGLAYLSGARIPGAINRTVRASRPMALGVPAELVPTTIWWAGNPPNKRDLQD